MALKQERPGYWRGDVWHQGQRVKLTFEGTAKEAKAYEAKRRLEIEQQGVIHARQVPTFERFVEDKYKPAAEKMLRASTYSIRKTHLKTLIEHFGATQLTKLNEQQIEAYKLARRNDGLGPVSVNNELMAFSAVLTYARDVLKVPCAKPKITRYSRKKKNKSKVKFFSRDEVGWILAAAKEHAADFLPCVEFLLGTGCRKSEAINLPWERVDFARKHVRIWSQEDEDDEEDDYEVKSEDSEREVPISDHLIAVLKAQKLKVGSSPWVFPVRRQTQADSKGGKYVAWPKHTWAMILRHAGEMASAATKTEIEITGGPHKCRHTYASFFLQSRPDLFALGRILGHSSARVTELYSHLLPDHLAEVRSAVPTFEAAKLG